MKPDPQPVRAAKPTHMPHADYLREQAYWRRTWAELGLAGWWTNATTAYRLRIDADRAEKFAAECEHPGVFARDPKVYSPWQFCPRCAEYVHNSQL